MLVQLLPEQVSEYWDMIGDSIEKSMPPMDFHSPPRMLNILTMLMLGDMQCWFIMSAPEITGENIVAIATTVVQGGGPTGIKTLEVYTLFARRELTKSMLSDAYNTLKKFAKSRDCYRIIAYSEIDRIISIVEELGGEAKYKFITLEV